MHFNAGIGAFQCRHWCISMGAFVPFNAFVHFDAGIGAFQWGHWCISTHALVHFNAGIGAFQRRHSCISMQALVHCKAGIRTHISQQYLNLCATGSGREVIGLPLETLPIDVWKTDSRFEQWKERFDEPSSASVVASMLRPSTVVV